jgi:hypothetical protein
VVSEKFKYLDNGTIFFSTVGVVWWGVGVGGCGCGCGWVCEGVGVGEGEGGWVDEGEGGSLG